MHCLKTALKIILLFAFLIAPLFISKTYFKVKGQSTHEWWDQKYPVYQQIYISNPTLQYVSSGTWITVNIDHKLMVNDKVSLTSGEDIRIVYKRGQNYEEIKFKIKFPYTDKTYIAFKTENEILGNGTDSSYYMYYGNLLSAEYPQSYEYLPTEYENTLTYSIGERVYNEIIRTELNRGWFLKDTDIEIQSNTNLKFYVNPPFSNSSIEKVTYFILETEKTGEMKWGTENSYTAEVNVGDLGVGIYQIQASVLSDASETKSAPEEFYISYPLYVTWTMDWEGIDVEDKYLNSIKGLSDRYSIPVTHFFNPRLFITKDVSSERKKALTDWIRKRNLEYGDEIGMHIHAHYDLVKATGVNQINQPQWANLNTGYDVPLSEYSYEDTLQILNWGKEQFKNNNIGNPISFRAGGWYADLDTLRAIQDSGFLIDSSGRTAYTFGKNNISGYWDLTPVTKPYQPSISDQNTSSSTNFSIWEFPNNALDSTNSNSIDIIQRFNDNYSNYPLNESQVVTYLSHPHWFDKDGGEMDKVLSYTDQFSFTKDNGPVVYATLRNTYKYLTNSQLPPEDIKPVSEGLGGILGNIQFNIWWILIPFTVLGAIVVIFKIFLDRTSEY